MGEDWNWDMYIWVRAYGAGSTGGYLIAVLGNIVLFSLFTAILLNNFEGDDEEGGNEEEEDEEEEEEAKEESKPPPKPFLKRLCDKEKWNGFM